MTTEQKIKVCTRNLENEPKDESFKITVKIGFLAIMVFASTSLTILSFKNIADVENDFINIKEMRKSFGQESYLMRAVSDEHDFIISELKVCQKDYNIGLSECLPLVKEMAIKKGLDENKTERAFQDLNNLHAKYFSADLLKE